VFSDAGFHVGKDEAENACHVGFELRCGLSRVAQMVQKAGLLALADSIQPGLDGGGGDFHCATA